MKSPEYTMYCHQVSISCDEQRNTYMSLLYQYPNQEGEPLIEDVGGLIIEDTDGTFTLIIKEIGPVKFQKIDKTM